jgi:hypothetical protein
LNSIDLFFLGATGGALLLLPRRWAFTPLMVGTCLMTLGHVLILGPFDFSVLRILIAVGLFRTGVRLERPHGGIRAVDVLLAAWVCWMVLSSAFHDQPATDLTTKLGLAYDALGAYALLRIFCHSTEDVKRIARFTAVLLLPVAAAMAYEHVADRNLFSALGGVPELPMVRDGKIRAYGPFLHPILAGTVGALSMIMMGSIWSQYRKTALVGIFAGLLMVLCSNSSGPLMSVMAGIFGFICWRYRAHLRVLRWGAVAGYVLLDLVMKDPAYFILSRIDLTGSSTGWHRAELIRSAFAHLGEWWLGGTDHTRHWMPTGVSWNADHTDITNHYLKMGVMGGLPLMVLLIATNWAAFRGVSRALQRQSDDDFVKWTLGVTLFCHATTFVAVSYFDQSVIFYYLTLACVTSVAVAEPAHIRQAHAPPLRINSATERRAWQEGRFSRRRPPAAQPLRRPQGWTMRARPR